MKITKLGHCCLLIEENGLKILTDPGAFTVEVQGDVLGVNVIVITHEHRDHLHVESLKEILKNNPHAKIVTNNAVKNILEKENISAEAVGDGQNASFGGFEIEGYGKDHAVIYRDYNLVENTGYFFGGRLFYPGDAFYVPKRQTEILALPVAGPWMKISEAMDYAISVKPKFAFPVHDGMLNQFGGFINNMGQNILQPDGIEYQALELQKPVEF